MSVKDGHLHSYSYDDTQEIMSAVCLGRISNNKIVVSIPLRDGEIDLPKLKAANAIKRAQNSYETEATHDR